MFTLRPSKERGYFNHGWLDTYHSFSFGDYHDPKHMSFRSLRVINEDVVAPGHGFGMHPHRNMEIVTYILSGSLEHQDSLGSRGTIRPGEIQRITAGSGVLHSEVNPSPSEPVHLLQIWLTPEKLNLAPSYEQKVIGPQKPGELTLIASRTPSEGAVTIHQDVDIYRGIMKPGEELSFALRPGRAAWIQSARGGLLVNNNVVDSGDGAGIENESALVISARSDAEFLLFDLA